MRRNKTYLQQKKFYDKSNNFESLGSLFLYWFEKGNMSAKDMQATYLEGDTMCQERIFNELYHLIDRKTLYILSCIFSYGHR